MPVTIFYGLFNKLQLYLKNYTGITRQLTIKIETDDDAICQFSTTCIWHVNRTNTAFTMLYARASRVFHGDQFEIFHILIEDPNIFDGCFFFFWGGGPLLSEGHATYF